MDLIRECCVCVYFSRGKCCFLHSSIKQMWNASTYSKSKIKCLMMLWTECVFDGIPIIFSHNRYRWTANAKLMRWTFFNKKTKTKIKNYNFITEVIGKVSSSVSPWKLSHKSFCRNNKRELLLWFSEKFKFELSGPKSQHISVLIWSKSVVKKLGRHQWMAIVNSICAQWKIWKKSKGQIAQLFYCQCQNRAYFFQVRVDRFFVHFRHAFTPMKDGKKWFLTFCEKFKLNII